MGDLGLFSGIFSQHNSKFGQWDALLYTYNKTGGVGLLFETKRLISRQKKEHARRLPKGVKNSAYFLGKSMEKLGEGVLLKKERRNLLKFSYRNNSLKLGNRMIWAPKSFVGKIAFPSFLILVINLGGMGFFHISYFYNHFKEMAQDELQHDVDFHTADMISKIEELQGMLLF